MISSIERQRGQNISRRVNVYRSIVDSSEHIQRVSSMIPAIVVRQKIWPKLTHVTLESPPLTCVIKDKPYAVSIHIEAADGQVVQKLDTTVTSSLDQSILPDRPLVVGPVYELNKDLKGHPDGVLPDAPKQDCPAKA